MLKHVVIVADEWHDNGPQDLVTVSLSIQIAIDKMQLCLLSVAYASPYHNPTTKGHSVHNIDIRKLPVHTAQYTLSTICPVQLIPGFICEEHNAPACQWQYEYMPSEVGYDAELQSGQDPVEDDEHAHELP